MTYLSLDNQIKWFCITIPGITTKKNRDKIIIFVCFILSVCLTKAFYINERHEHKKKVHRQIQLMDFHQHCAFMDK